jgi:hypothetical protein
MTLGNLSLSYPDSKKFSILYQTVNGGNTPFYYGTFLGKSLSTTDGTSFTFHSDGNSRYMSAIELGSSGINFYSNTQAATTDQTGITFNELLSSRVMTVAAVNGSAGRVGIGSASPGVELDVIGTVRATTLTGAGSGITALNMDNAGSGTLAVARGGTGVTTSTGTGSVVLSAGPTFTGTVTAATVTSIATPAAAANVLTVRGSSTAGNVVQFSNTAGGTFIMTRAGYVGIGTTDPGCFLDFKRSGNYNQIISLAGGTGTASSTATDFVGFGIIGTISLRYQSASAGSGGHYWYNGASEYMRLITIAGYPALGIGTSPSYSLDIGTPTSSTHTLRLQAASTTTGTMGTSIRMIEAASDQYGFSFQNLSGSRLGIFRHSGSSAGAEVISIKRDSLGVGIGTTNPGGPLQIYNANSTANDPRASHLDCWNPTNSAGQSSIITSRIGGSAAGNTYYSMDVSGSYGFSIGMAANSSRLQFRDTWNFLGNERMSILGSGNVGIGTTNPTQVLEVNGNARITGSSSKARLVLGPAPSTTNLDYCSLIETEYNIASNYYSQMKFYTHNTTSTAGDPTFAMIIDYKQGVGIGTANPVNWFGQACKASVFGSSVDSSAFHVDSGSMSAGDLITMAKRYNFNYLIRMDSTPNSYPANFLFFATNNGANNPGTITATNATTMVYGSTSDYRIKSNVVPLSNSIEFINKLRPVNFTFNENPTEVVGGFIAHEIQELIPHAVTGVKDDVDENGKMRIQNLDVSFVTPYLTAAVKDLVAKNTALETQLQTAQNDIDLLESRLAAIEALISTNTSADVEPTTGGTRADALLSQV